MSTGKALDAIHQEVVTKREAQIKEIKWELALLLEHDKLLRQNGRENSYTDDKRIEILRMRLDHYLGFHEPKEFPDEP